MLNFIESNIPAELQQLPQWVVWRARPKPNGKTDKIPFDPVSGALASSTNPATWGSFRQAVAAAKNGGGYFGIGFVLNGSDLTGVDLDDCVDVNGKIEPWALEIVNMLNSYTEVSPSGKGLRIFLRGKLNRPGRRKGPIEVYNTGRFLTVTGNRVDGTPINIMDRYEELDAFHQVYIAKPTQEQKLPAGNGVELGDMELISRATKAKNGDLFARLYSGDWAGYASQSEADQAFCNMLAFWTGRNAEQIDRIFRQSGLYRQKWERDDYRNWTIEKAIKDTTEVYTAGKSSPVQDFEPVQEEPELLPFRFSDTGNAERLIALHGKNIHYSFPQKSWYVWDGKRWRADDTGTVNRMAVDMVRRMRRQAAEIKDNDISRSLSDWANKSDTDARIRYMLNQARSISGVPVLPTDFDKQPLLLNCQNGTLDLETGRLIEHRREDLLTKIIPVNYDPYAVCPTWEAFIYRAMGGSRKLIDYLQKITGISLTGITVKKFFFVYGRPDTGKSKFVETIRELLGDYGRGIDIEVLMAQKNSRGGGPNPELARLYGARIVVASETAETRRLNEGLIKRMTGSDTLTVRTLHAEPFDFVPCYKIWIHGNFKPIIRAEDEGLWERLVLIPFDNVIPKHEQDPKLADKFRAEFPGILAWAVRGCMHWVADGCKDPVQPEEFQALTGEYRYSMDTLQQFIDDCCSVSPHVTTSNTMLYEKYQHWCERNGDIPLKQKAFTLRLQEKGFTRERTSTARFWRGIGLINIS